MALRHRDREPTPQEVARAEAGAQQETYELTNEFDATAQLQRIREFSDKVLVDALAQTYFSPTYSVNGEDKPNPCYHPALMPLFPFCLQAPRLGKMNQKEIQRFLSRVDSAAQRCYSLVDLEVTDHEEARRIEANIKSITDYVSSVVPSWAFDGFALKTIFEQRKTVNLLHGGDEKKGFRLW